MDITAISDLHGHFPKDLPGGDLLIVAGDLTARDTGKEHEKFIQWLKSQNYKKRVVIPGNHDNHLESYHSSFVGTTGMFNRENHSDVLLCDSGTEFEGLKIWGSPWTKTFEGINPHCKAFTVDTEEELNKYWKLIPDNVDILVTHSPPYGILDEVWIYDWDKGQQRQRHVGSTSLAAKIGLMSNSLKCWIWGHIHECYGIEEIITFKKCKMVNASHVNEHYQPVNKPIRVIL